MDEEIVGHKTFSTGDPLHPFRHEPLTKKEADELLERVSETKRRRAATYPTTEHCIRAIFDACQRLEELGWKRAEYAFPDRKEKFTISLGSTGIHKAYCEARTSPPISNGNWWWHRSEGDLWPHDPIYYRDSQSDPS